MKTDDKRVSVVLSPEQLTKINELQENMDIDLSKVVRWCVDTCFDMGETLPELHAVIGPEYSGKLRQVISARSNFLLDTIAEQAEQEGL